MSVLSPGMGLLAWGGGVMDGRRGVVTALRGVRRRRVWSGGAAPAPRRKGNPREHEDNPDRAHDPLSVNESTRTERDSVNQG